MNYQTMPKKYINLLNSYGFTASGVYKGLEECVFYNTTNDYIYMSESGKFLTALNDDVENEIEITMDLEVFLENNFKKTFIKTFEEFKVSERFEISKIYKDEDVMEKGLEILKDLLPSKLKGVKTKTNRRGDLYLSFKNLKGDEIAVYVDEEEKYKIVNMVSKREEIFSENEITKEFKHWVL